MNFEQYQQVAARTEKVFPTKNERINHAILGMLTELGELGDCFKRVTIYGNDLDHVLKDGQTIRSNVCEEAGDIAWYAAIIFSVFDEKMEAEDISLKSSTTLTFAQTLDAYYGAVATVSKMSEERLNSDDVKTRLKMLSLTRHVLGLVKIIVEASSPADAMSDALQRNIDKLQKRYQKGYSDAAANARADKEDK